MPESTTFLSLTARVTGIAVCCLLAVCPVRAQNIATLFIQVPIHELPLLETNPRLDMLDLYNYKMTAKGENIFGGTSFLLHKTENHLMVQLTEVSRWELMRLKTDSSELYACTHTLTAPVGESRISFYHPGWQHATITTLPPFTLDDFWQTNDSISADRAREVYEKLQPLHVTMKWKDEEGISRPTLTLQVSTGLLNDEDRKAAEHCLKTICLIWNGKDFSLSEIDKK